METTRSLKAASAFSISLLLIGGIALPMLSPILAGAAHSQCSDGVDNDNDGRYDYPQDPDCRDIDDQSESSLNGGVFVSVTDGRDEVTAGDTLTYIITVRQDRDGSDSVDVNFHLPAQTRIQGASDGGSISPTSVTWNDVTVYRGAVKTLQVTAYVDPNVTVDQLIVARVSADGISATDTTMIRNTRVPYETVRATLSINDGRKTAAPGQELEYTVTVSNPSRRGFTDDLIVTGGQNMRIVSAVGGDIDARSASWRNVTIEGNSVTTFRFRGVVEPHDRRMAFVDAVARMGTLSATDRTVIQSGDFPTDALGVTITDGRSRANRGDELTYLVRLTNRSSLTETHGFVSASLPLYSSFVDATEGGDWDGNNVRWTNLVVPAGASREVRYTVRVRNDAPRNAVLTAGVSVKGGESAEDRTGLDDGSFTYVPESSRGRGPILTVGTPILDKLVFRKSANRAEVLPGDQIRYTLFVQNRYDHPLTNIVITDTFDPSALTVIRAGDNADIYGGQIDWVIPVLAPGQSWQTTYTLGVDDYVARGSTLRNVASITADEIVRVTAINADAYTIRTVVVNGTPQAGGADFFAALQDTSALLRPVTGSTAAATASWMSMAVAGLGAGIRTGRKFL